MTSQSKTYIETTDIIGLRLQCKSCQCSLLIETQHEDGAINNLLSLNSNVLTKCPTCGAAWTESSVVNRFDSEVKVFFRALRDLRKAEPRFGCSLSLEIKGLASSSDRDSGGKD